ncbi:hypothetical protein A1O1_04771 [Capronia coronata CBS 617.96]|uniref:Delta 8-(E)-sphingolipid desaturase n=1 Tax=Capronia coronata CBS 617.96 TaxID=1182541 RepID=W9Z005_9EURO|nr:uncharacterized protein A1O1_04771 [Capronia coronata CBS 617.96]EXJ87844.1 hypothetical protein A1O1_04771 [Capronia coronata CBS 617.96]
MPGPTSRNPRTAVLSIEDIKSLIAKGSTIVIFKQKVLNLDSWLPFHPGGAKIVLHVVGKDATDEINAFHSPGAISLMQRFQIGTIEGTWDNLLPPIQGGSYQDRDGVLLDDKGSDMSTDSPCMLSDVASLPDSPTCHKRCLASDSDDDLKPSTTSNSQDPLVDEKEHSMSLIDLGNKTRVTLDPSMYPAAGTEIQSDVAIKYRLLDQRLHDQGLYQCHYSAYGIEAARCTVIFFAMTFAVYHGWVLIGGVFLGLFWHQMVFIAHDAGHSGITHNFTIDSVIAMTVGSHIGGLSMGWWKKSHNIHHVATNAPEHDPDIQHLPFFAVSLRFMNSIYSTYYERIMSHTRVSKFLLRYQAYYYYAGLTLGRFNLYVLSWQHLLQGGRKGRTWWYPWFELSGHIFFWTWFGYFLVYRSIQTAWSRFGFVMVSHMTTMPLHVQFTLSHFAMSTASLGPQESFPQRMLRTTMDVDCPPWLDFLHGGLQFQAVHHLFPRLPRHNLRRAQKLVRDFCLDVGIPFAVYGVVDSNKVVLGHLDDIGRQVAIMEKCRDVIMQTDHAVRE